MRTVENMYFRGMELIENQIRSYDRFFNALHVSHFDRQTTCQDNALIPRVVKRDEFTGTQIDSVQNSGVLNIKAY